MYFPESDCPFYRATVFSNYSTNNAPKGHWSLILEVSETVHKLINYDVVEECLKGALNTKLLDKDSKVVSKWHKCLPFGYPVPTNGRERLADIDSILLSLNIWSRGRFGGWKYEVGNMDHSFMQGVEAVDNILSGTVEMTYGIPNIINSGGCRNMRFRP